MALFIFAKEMFSFAYKLISLSPPPPPAQRKKAAWIVLLFQFFKRSTLEFIVNFEILSFLQHKYMCGKVSDACVSTRMRSTNFEDPRRAVYPQGLYKYFQKFKGLVIFLVTLLVR